MVRARSLLLPLVCNVMSRQEELEELKSQEIATSMALRKKSHVYGSRITNTVRTLLAPAEKVNY